ncbi:MAG: carbohydrate binding family 9 domain-containing protein, partial [Bacteroidia bacterium]|nr:carbohydrate binding family 9 domain-containing protein [Bacteroidia bacterium]
MKKTYLLILFIFIVIQGYTQNSSRSINAIRVSNPPKIDGKLDEALWINVPVASNFTQVEPINGEPSRKRTEVKVVYDNTAIYVGAMMYDDEPDKILKELGKRDAGENNADIFAVFFDTYNDDINAFAFTVSASGVQSDIKFSANGAAFVWDAVWQSKVSIVENGWVAELKIPYSAIRFSDQLEQTWGINFIRIIRRYREKSSWNLFDLSVDGFVNQFGELNGIEDIKSPIRLSVMPYLSAYMEHYPFNIEGKSNLSYSFNGGMDLKYGLSESFTLDMTIVPDFGQVRSDNEVLNLSPFEVRYDENRQFFTEGTEL